MSTPYARAEARLKEIKAEAAEIEVFLRTYRRFADEDPDPGERAPEGDRLQATVTVNPSKRETILTAAETALLAQQPLRTTDLLDRLEVAGVDIGGADKAVNLSSYLSKSSRFIHKRKEGGWFLTGNVKDGPTQEPIQGLEGAST